MFARLSKLPADDGGWAYEIKWDGVRAIAYVAAGGLRLESRNLNDVTARYPEVAGLAGALGAHEAVLDGEVVAFDEQGRPSFERLQGRMHLTTGVERRARAVPVAYMAFDLLWVDGEDLMRRPYTERRERLADLGLEGPAWRTPGYSTGNGAELLSASAAQGLEGIVCKRLDSPYEPGRRGGTWLKVKNTRRQELVIGGWLPGEGRRKGHLGALLVGYYDGDALRFAGKVGTGFDQRELERLERLLAPLERTSSPFEGRQPERGALFAEPQLVAEIEFTEWTSQGMLRHPSYKGLRDDKRALDVVLESPS
jgi:bifunctional non-homologous end joining protein LigD